jgi:hypothetical protein
MLFLLVMLLTTPKGQFFQSAPQVFQSNQECQMALAASQHQLEEQLDKAKARDGYKFEFSCLQWTR